MTPELAYLCTLIGAPEQPPPPGLDARRFAELLRHHRLAARFAGRVAGHLAEPGPLPDLARQAVERTLWRAAGLVRIAERFTAAGVPLVAVKGPAFAMRLCGSLTARDGRDLDLLIRPRDAAAAQRLLAELGYTPLGSRDLIVDGSIELAAAAAPLVELHTRLAADRRLVPLDRLDPFGRSVPVRLGGVTVATLADADALAFAASHGLRHAWARLMWLADLVPVAHGAVALTELQQRAARLGCQGALTHGLALLEALCGVAPPPDWPLSPTIRRRAAAFAPVFADPPVLDRGAMHRIGILRFALLEMAAQDRLADRLVIAKQHLRPTERDHAWVPLPRWAGALYWLVRPLRLLLRRG